MNNLTWKIERIADVNAEEFYALIDRNHNHIHKGFPRTLSGCDTLEKTIVFLKQAVDNEMWADNYYFYIRNLNDNSLIGYTLIKNIDTYIHKCELAYFIDKDYGGRGIISEAVRHMMDFCFGELKMNKACISTALDNVASQQIALKHGFIQEGVLRQEHLNGEGILEDIIYFGLLKSDYKNER